MVDVNYFAVLVAAVVSIGIGFLWYAPAVLGKPWMKEKGYSSESLKKEQKEMGKFYAVSFGLAIIMAYALAHVMFLSQNFYDYPMLSTGVMSGFFMWFGFVMPVQLTNQIFGKKNWTLFGIDTWYQLVSLLVMGVVIDIL